MNNTKQSQTYQRIKSDFPELCPEQRQAVCARFSIKQRLIALFFMHTAGVEFALSTACIGFGVMAWLPYDTFAIQFPNLFRHVTEPILGAWLVGLGLVRVALLFHGEVKPRKYCALLAFITWSYLASWVLISDWHRFSMIFFSGASMASMWVFLRGPSEWPE